MLRSPIWDFFFCEQVGLKAPYLPDHLPACAEYYLRHLA